MEYMEALYLWQELWVDDPCDDCTHWVGII